MRQHEAIKYIQIRQDIRHAIQAALTDTTDAGRSVHIERSASFNVDEIPYINIQHLPKRESDDCKHFFDLIISAGVRADPNATCEIDPETGVKYPAVVQVAEQLEEQLIKALGCIKASDCACGLFEIEPGGLYFDEQGDMSSAIVKVRVTFTAQFM